MKSAPTTEPEAPSLVDLGFANINEAAVFLRVSRATIYQLMESGELPFAKFGKSRRLPWKGIKEYGRRCLLRGEA